MLALTSWDLSDPDELEVSLSLELPRLLVAGGRKDELHVSSLVHIISQNESSQLSNSLPVTLYGSATLTRENDNPVMCGGKTSYYERTSTCFSYQRDSSAWTDMDLPMIKPRYGAKSVFLQDSQSFWVLGGANDKSTEIFNGTNWQLGPELPRSLSKFCLIDLQDGSFMIIGGKLKLLIEIQCIFQVPFSK